MEALHVHTKDELREQGLKGIGEIIAGREPAQKYAIRMGSGTTGNTPAMTMLHSDFVPNNEMEFKRGGRNLLAYGVLSMNIRNILPIFEDASTADTEIMLLPQKDMDPDLDRLLCDYSPELLCGPSSTQIKILSSAPRGTAHLKALRSAGEMTDAASYDTLQKLAPQAHFSFYYGTAETAMIATSCPHLAINQYHLYENVHVDIQDPDPSGIGSILVTKYINPFICVERFPTGDAGRMIGPCRCGQTETLEFVGRVDFDFIRIAGVVLHRVEFDRVAAKFSHHIADYEAQVTTVKKNNKTAGKITLLVVHKSGGGTLDDAHALAEEFAKNLFVSPQHTLQEAVERGYFVPLIIEFVPKLEDRIKSVRLRRI